MSSETRSRAAALWPLITGLAVGFIVGRETGPKRGGSEEEASSESEAAPPSKPAAPSAAAPAAAAPSRVYRAEKDFPPTWLKTTDLTGVASVSFDGLSEAQKVTAMQAANERN